MEVNFTQYFSLLLFFKEQLTKQFFSSSKGFGGSPIGGPGAFGGGPGGFSGGPGGFAGGQGGFGGGPGAFTGGSYPPGLAGAYGPGGIPLPYNGKSGSDILADEPDDKKNASKKST